MENQPSKLGPRTIMPKIDLIEDDSDRFESDVSERADSQVSRAPRKQRNVLVIEDDDVDFDSVERSPDNTEEISFQVERAIQLSNGLKRLAEGGIHVVLLDLDLPDSQGLETF